MVQYPYVAWFDFVILSLHHPPTSFRVSFAKRGMTCALTS